MIPTPPPMKPCTREQFQKAAGALLKEWREAAGKTIHEARRATVPRIGLVELERVEEGKRHIEMFTLRALVRLYGHSAEYFFQVLEERL